ncbi:TIGR04086 family membrane protein [Peptococcaceae bacterium 1198_IL3148]
MKRLTFLSWSAPIKGQKNVYPGAVLLGVTWSICISIAVVLALGVYIMVTAAPVYHLTTIIFISVVISSLLGAMICGAVANKQGMRHGLLVGSLYALCFAAVSVYLGVYTLELGLLLAILPLIMAGVIGGILGVNLPSTRRMKRRAV